MDSAKRILNIWRQFVLCSRSCTWHAWYEFALEMGKRMMEKLDAWLQLGMFPVFLATQHCITGVRQACNGQKYQQDVTGSRVPKICMHSQAETHNHHYLQLVS